MILLMNLPQEDLNEPTLQTNPLPDLENVQTHLTNHLQGQIEGKGQILVTNLQLERDEIPEDDMDEEAIEPLLDLEDSRARINHIQCKDATLCPKKI